MDCMEGMKHIPDKSVNLIISDPPYFRVKGKFDFVWESFDDYLADVERWAKECKRVLSENGTLYWFGGAKRIAYTQIILDKYFGLVNSLVWENTNDHKQQIRFNEDLRSYAPLTERILMYSNDVYNLTQCVYNIRDYIRDEIKRARGEIVFKEINAALGTAINGGGVASACLSLHKAEPAMFTKDMYQKLREWLNSVDEYEYLRKEYEDLRRPFDNFLHLGDVIRLPNRESINHEHETVKPEKLSRILIKTSSRENDLVLVPFAGSGTECAMAVKEGRRFIGFEIDEDYHKAATKRIEIHKQQLKLFC